MRPDRIGLWTLWRAESLFSGNGNPRQGVMVAYDVVGGIAMVAAQGAGGCATSPHVGSVHAQADEGGCGRRPVAARIRPPPRGTGSGVLGVGLLCHGLILLTIAFFGLLSLGFLRLSE